MVITSTPLRISFFGGGTDYPVWYRQHGGAVLSTTIDKYCYVTTRWLPPFFEYHSRVSYSKMENVNRNSAIDHPAAERFGRDALGVIRNHQHIGVFQFLLA